VVVLGVLAVSSTVRPLVCNLSDVAWISSLREVSKLGVVAICVKFTSKCKKEESVLSCEGNFSTSDTVESSVVSSPIVDFVSTESEVPLTSACDLALIRIVVVSPSAVITASVENDGETDVTECFASDQVSWLDILKVAVVNFSEPDDFGLNASNVDSA
jgi:hypothetical protein